ncbi:hypothetical protein [Streptomyces flavofungini]|uniref:hypothetical protein n=1 Tax=Streptomyces flavofungini TaxID=68200 RepID=UPI0034DF4558
MDVDDLPRVAPPEDPLDFEIWDLLEVGGRERLPLLTAEEAQAVVLLLRILAAGDGMGHEQALTLSGRISRRLPEG